MKTYNIYINSKAKTQDGMEDIILIPETFNWYCLIFSSFWAIYKRVWNVLIIYVIVAILGAIASHFFLSITQTEIIKFFISVIISFNANEYYGNSLIKKGYKLVGLIHGNSYDEALIRFLEKENHKPKTVKHKK
jgi:hypothetical protein